MNKPNNIIRIPTSSLESFFKYWVTFLKPFHNLTDRESEVAALLLMHRHELSKVIKDDSVLDKVSMSEDVRKSIREKCGITVTHLQVILGKLKKNKVIIDGKINPRFIPNIKEEDGIFQLLLLFDIK